MVERHGIAYHEKTLGQLFCDGSARRHRWHAARRVPRRRGSTCGLGPPHLTELSRATGFRIETDGAAAFSARTAWCLATGGLSIPQAGRHRVSRTTRRGGFGLAG